MTLDKFKEILRYDPIEGLFYWTKNRGRSTAGSVAGHKNSRGYIKIKTGGVSYSAHRLAILFSTGEWPKEEVDHINRVPHDNRIVNLRDCSHQDNCLNFPIYKNNNSGYIGVRYRKDSGRWRAFVRINKKEKHIGTFSSKEEAYAARIEYIKENPDAYGNL